MTRRDADEDAERAEHRAFARQANRETWDLLQQPDRNVADDEHMIHSAHASAFHWAAVGGSVESTRADWLLSHVYAVLGRPEPALRYAQQCLATCQREGIGDFDLAYAREAVARAIAASGDLESAARLRAEAVQAGDDIAEVEDRDQFLADLAAEPWYGLSA